MSKKGHLILALVKLLVSLWEFLTYPFYQLFTRPWERRQAYTRTRAKAIRSNAHEVVYESPEKTSLLYMDLVKSKASTMKEVWSYCVQKYGSKELLGTREILDEEDEVQSNGKMFKKFILGDYRWISYQDADTSADYFGRGLRALGMKPHDNVCVFAETRAEWMISAQACFKQAFSLVTLYTNLGDEAVVHGVNQTKCSHILTTHDLLPKFKNILLHTPTVTTVVFFEDQIKKTDTNGFPPNVKIVPFYDVVTKGTKLSKSEEVAPPANAPQKNDIAIIMFTSGSTGVPKGVMLTHKNLHTTLCSLIMNIDIVANKSDAYLAYLPLAHVLELISEMLMCTHGVRIGYSNANTMIDKSSMVKKGHKGDATVLRPTIMGAVPLVLDRIYKGISDQVARSGPTFQQLFTWAYNYRLEAMRNGETTPILDFLVFRKIRGMLGGRVRLMFSGGAPLSPETNDFIRVCMGAPVLQGYGLTETNACATLTHLDQITTGTVGPPNPLVQIKLVNWEEGNYRVTDKPRPRGEIIIGGNCVAAGYYGMPDKTAEEFYEEGGRKWFKTGDIGQIEPDGSVKIIDRKKDLVKLQFGEYVSLGKVESVLKTCPAIENICVYGDSFKSYCVAIVCPDRRMVKEFGAKFGKTELSFDSLCQDRDVTGAVLREITNHGNKFKLQKFEIPGAVVLVKETWDPDSGLVTAALKLKRKEIQDFYQRDIDRMYGISSGSSGRGV